MSDIFHLPNPPIFRGNIPKNIYNSVMSEIKDIEKNGSPNTHNDHLVGIIEREYKLIKSRDVFVPFLKDMLNQYLMEVYQTDTGSTSSFYNTVRHKKEWDVSDIWVNLQKKYEYNPLHNHSGDFSFVSWMELPYNISDEQNVKNVKYGRAKGMASTFEFVYTNILGEIGTYCIPVEKGWEGRIIIFPARLLHQVYAFQTSDNYRISISGNFKHQFDDPYGQNRFSPYLEE